MSAKIGKPNKGRPSENEEESPIEGLRESLYSRQQDGRSEPVRDFRFRPRQDVARRSWLDEGVSREEPMPVIPMRSDRMTLLKKLLLASGAFFVVALLIALYMFFVRGNIVSSSNVDISIAGPVSIGGGETLTLQVSVQNQNNAPLESADLLLQYPDGTRRAGDLNVELRRYREEIGPIEAGRTIDHKIDAVLFGEEGERKEILVTVEYRIKGSNATFYKEKKYELIISSSPVTLIIDAVKEASSSQDLEFSVTIGSNSNVVINNLLLRAEYPFGFDFESAVPASSSGNNVWSMGDLKPSGKRVVKIKGKIEGLDGDERTFRFSVGTASPKDERSLGTVFLTDTQSVMIKKPFVGIELALDGDSSSDFVSRAGRTVRADISWVNNVGVRIIDVDISAALKGRIFDRSTVLADNGFYRSIDNTLIWDQTRDPSLANINPGAAGRASFSFSLLPSNQTSLIKNPQMDLEITVRGKRLSEDGAPEEVSSTLSRTIKLASDLSLSTRILYFTGPFSNSGPLPPTVEKATTYTIVWTVSNTSNNIVHGRVLATLPPYVQWLNTYVPQTERLSYNPVGGEVIWDLGDVKAGTGFESNSREVSFQVSFLPSLSQVGATPVIIGDASASADDTFTNTPVKSNTRGALTTELNTDPLFKGGQGTVIK